jgi:hypothetical protein
MTPSVHDPNHTNDARKDAIIHRIGEPAEQNAAKGWGHQGIGFRALPNPLERFVHRIEKAARDLVASASSASAIERRRTGSTRRGAA